MSLASRLLNIFASPSEAFDAVKASAPSTANWLAPALLLILISWVGAAVVLSQDSIRRQMSEVASQAIEKQIQKMHLPPDKAEQARQQGEKWAGLSTTIGAYTGPIAVALVSPFWWGLILWLVGAKVLKGGFPFMKAVEAAGLSNMILALEAIVRTLLILATGNLFASPSLVLLVKEFDPQNPEHALLGAINVMTLWALAIRSLGMARLTGVSFWKAALWVFGLWATYTAVATGLGAALASLAR
jgi:hypothetical protein